MSIASEITRLSSAKAALKDAIVAKGVEVADDVKLDGYAAKVDAIQVGEDWIKQEWHNDGCSHFWVKVGEGNNSSIVIRAYLTNSSIAKIDWGDGNKDDIPIGTLTGRNLLHTYTDSGVYDINISGYEVISLHDPVFSYEYTSAGRNCSNKVYQIELSKCTRLLRSFRFCTNLRYVKCDESLYQIVDAFEFCTALKRIEGSFAGVTDLGDLAFAECYELESIPEFESLETLWNYGSTASPFRCTSSLKHVVMNNLKSVQRYFMCWTYSLQEIRFPSLTSIPYSLTNNTFDLETIDMPLLETTSGICSSANRITSINLPNLKNITASVLQGSVVDCQEIHLENLENTPSFGITMPKEVDHETHFYFSSKLQTLNESGNNSSLFIVWGDPTGVHIHLPHNVDEWRTVSFIGNYAREAFLNRYCSFSVGGYATFHFEGVTKDQATSVIPVFPFTTNQNTRYIFSDTEDGHYWIFNGYSDKVGTYH